MESTQLVINVVPAHDSPKNILNLLNDDCIQIILRKLTNIRDFFSAAETCMRFQENAKQCFPLHFKKITIHNNCDWNLKALPIKRAKGFLNIFGHLIRSLDVHHYNIFKITRQYCSKTLSKLVLCGIYINVNLSMFKSLEELKIKDCSINELYLPTTLKVLELYCVELEYNRLEWNRKQELLKLEHAVFFKVNLNDTEFITFLSFTPQLQRLKISYCDKLIPHNENPNYFFAAIGNLVPDLIDLKIDLGDCTAGIDWAPMIQLKRLKCFHLYGLGSIDQLIKLFAEHKVPIEELAFTDHYLYSGNRVHNLLKLKQLKKLIITIDAIIPSNDFVQMTKELPALTKINFTTRTITSQQIVEALEYGKNLNKIHIITNFFDMNESEFFSIRNRLTKCYLGIIALRGDIYFPDCTGFGYEDEQFSIEFGKFILQRFCEKHLSSSCFNECGQRVF